MCRNNLLDGKVQGIKCKKMDIISTFEQYGHTDIYGDLYTEFHTDTATYIQMYVYTQDSIVWYFLHPLGP